MNYLKPSNVDKKFESQLIWNLIIEYELLISLTSRTKIWIRQTVKK